MKTLLSTACLGLVLLAFAGTESTTAKEGKSTSAICSAVYQDTIPKKDTMHKKDRKDRKEKRDTMSVR